MRFSISYTTRPQRPNEDHGHDYHFVGKAEFDRMVKAGEFLEHAQVFDNYYGTARRSVEAELRQGHDLLLEIDWQGARQVRKPCREAVSVFILPPSLDELGGACRNVPKKNAATDGTRTCRTETERRLREAVGDMSHWREFDYVVVNDDFERAVAELGDVVAGRGEASRASRQHCNRLVAALLA